MPRPPGAKIGYDHGPIKRSLQASGLQHQNKAAFESIDKLIDAVKSIQGFIDDRFPQKDGSQSSLYDAVKTIFEELEDRNNSKYSVSLTNSATQAIPDSAKTVCTFDTIIFDDGLMFADKDGNPIDGQSITLNANGQYLITVRCKFAAP